MNIYKNIKEYFKKDENLPALMYMGRQFSYGELFAAIDDAAARLGALVATGDVVTVCMPNTPECVFCFYALNRIGATVHMVHPLAPLNQLKKYMAAARSKLLITLSVNLERYAPLAVERNIVSIHPCRSLSPFKRMLFDIKFKPYRGDMTGIIDYDDLKTGAMPPEPSAANDGAAVYLHSGGTGGEPKLIVLSADAINALGNRGLEALDLPDARRMYMLAAVPMSHGYGLTMGVHTTLTFGAVSVLMPKFDVKYAVGLIRKNKLHFLVGVPRLYRALLAQKGFNGKALRNIYVGFVGGDSAPQTLLDEFNMRLERAGARGRLFEGYGLTETTNVCAVNTYKHNRRGSLGKPLSGLGVAIVEPESGRLLASGEKGEIVVAGDTLMSGYLNNREETARAFVEFDGRSYVRTGDLGYVDDDGYLYFVQRLKRIIKISGISVYPSEIEASALELDGVTGACAVEYADGGKCKIALYLTGKKYDGDVVRKKISSDLSRYAIPSKVEFIDAIPLTPMLKVDAMALTERANAGVANRSGGQL